MTDENLEILRRALRRLDPIGTDGFEGFIAAVLMEVCGQPFRLASSGTQRGRDGDSAFDDGATYFEAKLYKDKVPKDAIAAKLMDLLVDNQGQVDTFIIGSTSPISAQIARDCVSAFESNGIGIVLLDWTANSRLPPLATVVVMGGFAAKDFLSTHLDDLNDAEVLSKALTAIDQLAKLREFTTQSEKLLKEIANPSVGLGLAKAANRSWFTRIFSSQSLARQQLGQPLAPCDKSMNSLQPRTDLIEKVESAFSRPGSENVFVLMGAEGTGKSWLVANTWMQSDPTSILLIAPAAEIQNPQDITGFEDFLIGRLIGQTGSDHTEVNQRRWRRRFSSWKANPDPPNVRITVCIDGLNQNPSYPWARLIDGATILLHELGGQLVVTTRTNYFSVIRPAIGTEVTCVHVPEWTKSELNAILRSRGITPELLSQEVFETLRNPRILSIALELLNAQEIENIDQLTVGRLLFEHLRTSNVTGSSNLNPAEFAKTLKELAADYIARLKAGNEDDLTLFDVRNHSRLDEVSSGRFFKPIDGDPDQIQIVDQGLQLALAMWLVDLLKQEARNKRDPYALLETVVEPVAGLDLTAEVVGTATEVACLTDSCDLNVKAALIRHFVSLQNLPESTRESFGSLVKNSPDAFLEAAKNVALFEEGVSTSNWLDVAILEARHHAQVRCAMERRLPLWLSYYCLAPERMMRVSARHSTEEEVQAERERVEEETKDRIEKLTVAERSYIQSNLNKLDVGNVDRLHRLVMFYLAGLPLKKFVGPLISSALCSSLAPTIESPASDFEHLMRFNCVDWASTRQALLEWIRCFGEKRSAVGNWTVVKALRSTGDATDAAESKRLTDLLTANREKILPWRLIENYCATDPCDPNSSKPGNIEDTAEKYRTTGVENIALMMGNSIDTRFFLDAMSGVARFEPEAGVLTIRKLSEHALERQGGARKRALLTLLPLSVLLERPVVDALVRHIQCLPGSLQSKSDFSDEWFIPQYSLFIALPHLTGNEQLSVLTSMPTDSLLEDLFGTMLPGEADVIESLIDAASANRDVNRLTNLIVAVAHASAPLTAKATAMIADLLEFPETNVRAQALAITSTSNNQSLLTRLVESNWDAGSLSPHVNERELWHGSAALVAAIRAGVVEEEEALDRMDLSHYGIAAGVLGKNGAKSIADRVEIALEKALGLGELLNLPDMEQTLPNENSSFQPHISLYEDPPPAGPWTHLDRLAETEEQYLERTRLLFEAYRKFDKKLGDSGAYLVLANLTTKGMDAIVSSRPDVISRWHGFLEGANEVQKQSVHSFAIDFAGAIAESNTELAVSLFRTYSTVKPVVRRVFGMAKVPIEASVVWSNGKIPEFSALCIERLEGCASDQEIALEVLAAFSHNQENLLAKYVNTLLATGEPVQIARALTIAGFSDESTFAEETLSKFSGTNGFIGEAQLAAKDAYDRNRWSRHWYESILSATTNVDFWRYSVLLTKIVDGRIDLWGDSSAATETFKSFLPTIRDSVEQRIKRWNDKRKKTLYGGKVPPIVFLIRDQIAQSREHHAQPSSSSV